MFPGKSQCSHYGISLQYLIPHFVFLRCPQLAQSVRLWASRCRGNPIVVFTEGREDWKGEALPESAFGS